MEKKRWDDENESSLTIWLLIGLVAGWPIHEKVFKTFLGIRYKFRVNIEDDLEYLSESISFIQNIGKLMTVDNFGKDSLRIR